MIAQLQFVTPSRPCSRKYELSTKYNVLSRAIMQGMVITMIIIGLPKM